MVSSGQQRQDSLLVALCSCYMLPFLISALEKQIRKWGGERKIEHEEVGQMLSQMANFLSGSDSKTAIFFPPPTRGRWGGWEETKTSRGFLPVGKITPISLFLRHSVPQGVVLNQTFLHLFSLLRGDHLIVCQSKEFFFQD